MTTTHPYGLQAPQNTNREKNGCLISLISYFPASTHTWATPCLGPSASPAVSDSRTAQDGPFGTLRTGKLTTEKKPPCPRREDRHDA
jgi:hypothetical protein